MSRSFPFLIGLFALVGFSSPAVADTAMEEALAGGAKQMSADEISERLAGKTVTFQPAGSQDKYLVYYDGANGTLIKKVGTEAVSEGFYAVSVADHVCLGARGGDPIKLRCVNVLEIEGKMHKFELDGSLRGTVIEEDDGNLM